MKSIKNLWLLSLLLVACSYTEPPLAPEYEAALNRYLKVVHLTGPDQLDQVVMVPLAGCNPCIKDVLNHLSQNTIDVELILTGINKDEEIKGLVETLQSQYSISWDQDNLHKKYRTNTSGPVLLGFESGKLKRLVKLEKSNLLSLL